MYDDGKPIAEFMHRRVKEFPVSGGPSVVAESFYDSRLQEYGRILCRELNWCGPIMCEFKYDSNADEYKLIEINPKLWGSLDLTIAAGVNIPELMIEYQMNGSKAEGLYPESKYIKFRWILSGEILHFVATYPKVKLSEFIKISPDEKTDLDVRDPLVKLYQIALTTVKLVPVIIKRIFKSSK